MAGNPYDYLNAINFTKVDMFAENEREAEESYVPFIVNRSLSYTVDTLAVADTMNQMAHVPKKTQFRYLLQTVPKKKRFSKWSKPGPNRLDIVMEWYKCGRATASLYASLLNDSDISDMEKKLNKETNNAPVRSGVKRQK